MPSCLLSTLTMMPSCCSTHCGPASQTQRPNSSSLSIRTGLCVTASQLMTASLSMAGCRLVIPAPMCKDGMNMLHASHQGKERSEQRARQIVYWPCLGNIIVNITRNYQSFQREIQSQPKEPYVAHENATRPFQQLSMDFATYAGRHILVVIDRYSSWTWVFVFPSANSCLLVGALRDVFCMSGAPDVIWSDNGPQFSSSRFQQFCREWGVSHRTSSPHYSPVERPLRSCRQIHEETPCRYWDSAGAQLSKDQWAKGILRYRKRPSKHGPFPAHLLFGQPVQDLVPAHHCAFKPEYHKAADTSDTLQADAEAVARYDSSAYPLPNFQIGTPVLLQNDRTKLWNRSSIVVDVGSHRKYFVCLPSILTRNRRFLCRRYSSSLPPIDAPRPPPAAQKPQITANPAPASVPPASSQNTPIITCEQEA